MVRQQIINGSFQWQIGVLDAAIDALVYELYGLTEDEVGIVEGKG